LKPSFWGVTRGRRSRRCATSGCFSTRTPSPCPPPAPPATPHRPASAPARTSLGPSPPAARPPLELRLTRRPPGLGCRSREQGPSQNSPRSRSFAGNRPERQTSWGSAACCFGSASAAGRVAGPCTALHASARLKGPRAAHRWAGAWRAEWRRLSGESWGLQCCSGGTLLGRGASAAVSAGLATGRCEGRGTSVFKAQIALGTQVGRAHHQPCTCPSFTVEGGDLVSGRRRNSGT
jgi:hypothetical protein